MARRKKDPPPPVSGAWESYKPDDDLYWRFGGPFVPVEDIPPSEYNYDQTAEHMKPAGRAKYLRELVSYAEDDQKRVVAHYLDLNERGIDAVSGDYQRNEDRKFDPDLWPNVARNYDRQRASCYRTIRMNKRKIASYTRQANQADGVSIPLLADLDD